MHTRQEVAELAAVLQSRWCKAPTGRTAGDTLRLLRLATAAQNQAIRLCNEGNYQETFDRKKASILKQVLILVFPYGLTATIGGDPRGSVTRLFSTRKREPLNGNTWGGNEDGYAI